MSNINERSKKLAFNIFITETLNETETEIEKLQQLLKTTHVLPSDVLTKYACVSTLPIIFGRFVEDMKHNDIYITDDEVSKYFNTFISLNPLDVFEVIKKMRKNVFNRVVPELFESEFRSYQQKLINLEKVINESEE